MRGEAVIVALVALSCRQGQDVGTLPTIDFDTVDHVRLDIAAGTVVIDTEGAGIDADLQWRGRAAPALLASVEDGVLSLTLDCEGVRSACAADLALHVRPGTSIEGLGGAGDWRLAGPLDAVDLSLDAGDVSLTDVQGPISLRLEAGDVRLDEVASSVVMMEVGSGDLTLDLTRVADHVSLTTGVGQVALTLPEGRYALDLFTGIGDTTVHGIDEDPASERLIEATVGVGSIVVAGVDAGQE